MPYPTGMTRSHWDRVEGVVRCEDCGADITRELEDLPVDTPQVCPGGCQYEPPEVDDYDRYIDSLNERW